MGNGGATSRDPRAGAAIDRHEAVFRFNFARTWAHEDYVGSKTTVRMINHNAHVAFNHLLSKANRTQPNAAATLNEKGWNADEYIVLKTKSAVAFRNLCRLMHNIPLYVMRGTILREGDALYSSICALLQHRRGECAPRCLWVNTEGLMISLFTVGGSCCASSVRIRSRA